MLDEVEIRIHPDNFWFKKRLQRYQGISLFLCKYAGEADEFFIEENGELCRVDVLGNVNIDTVSVLDLKTGIRWLKPVENFVEVDRKKTKEVYTGAMLVSAVYKTGVTEKQQMLLELSFENGVLKQIKTLKGPRILTPQSSNKKRYSTVKRLIKIFKREKEEIPF